MYLFLIHLSTSETGAPTEDYALKAGVVRMYFITSQ